MKNLTISALAVASLLCLPASAVAQVSTPMFDKISEGNYGEKGSLERNKICVLALKTYDYGVKSLGLGDADSKQAVRADKALPFTLIGLETKTQTPLLFDRAIADVKTEFSAFKSADAKVQKSLFKKAKGPNKKCAKPYDDRKLEGYGSLTRSADFLEGVSSDDAKACMGIAVSSMPVDRMAIATSVLQYMVWGEVYKNSLRAEGHPEDEIIEVMGVKEAQEHAGTLNPDTALELYESCPARFKKARFQAGLKKDEPAAVPEVDWN